MISDTDPSFEIPFGFAGGLYDRDTGLVRFGYRDYDPDIGRWTAKGPIFFGGGDTDLYGYCLNDPVNGVDPTGNGWPGIAFSVFRKIIKAKPTNDAPEQIEMEIDTDSDGINDYWDKDDDNDGVPDEQDDSPKKK